jgi:hypothetical protein
MTAWWYMSLLMICTQCPLFWCFFLLPFTTPSNEACFLLSADGNRVEGTIFNHAAGKLLGMPADSFVALSVPEQAKVLSGTLAEKEYLMLVDGKMFGTSPATRRLPLTIHEAAECGTIKDHSKSPNKRRRKRYVS